MFTGEKIITGDIRKQYVEMHSEADTGILTYELLRGFWRVLPLLYYLTSLSVIQ